MCLPYSEILSTLPMLPDSTVDNSIWADQLLRPTESNKNYSGILSTLPLIPETTTVNNSIRAELLPRLNELHRPGFEP